MNQLELDFGFSGRTKSYLDGYVTGVTWDASWMPAGPHIFVASRTNFREQYAEKERLSRLNHQYWMEGFSKGLEDLLESGSPFAKWWKENKGNDIRNSPLSKVRFFEYLPLSSVGRALALQARGRLFDPDRGNQI